MKSLFSFQGTIRRSQFWLGMLVVYSLLAAVGVWLPPDGLFWDGVLLVFVCGWLWLFFTLFVKRLCDADLSPWLCLLLFVPLANVAVFLIAGFKPTAQPPVPSP